MSPREAGRAAPGAFGANLDVRAGSLRLGDTTRLSEWRTEGSMHVAPTEGFRFRVAVPVLARQLVGPSLGDDRKPVAGDVSASMDAQISDTREGWWRRSFVLTVGLALPTGPAMVDAKGVYLPSILQPGCNSVVPETIVSYRFSKGAYSLTLAPRARLPIPVRDAPHRGATIGIGASGQWQPHPRFATRVASANATPQRTCLAFSTNETGVQPYPARAVGEHERTVAIHHEWRGPVGRLRRRSE
jgi:hypothetical protein